MTLHKYVIRQISALSIIASAAGEYGAWRFSFDATDPSKEYIVEETKQDDCAIYHQAMCVLYGENYQAESVCEKLKDALIYIDFSGTFDEKGYSRPVYAVNKAECIFCDFRNGGFRLLGDILCDLDELYSNQIILKNIIKDNDSPELKFILGGVNHFDDYKETIVSRCIALLSPPDRRERRVDFDEAVKCAVALGERRFVLEVLPYAALGWTVGPAEKKKRRWFGR